MRASRLGLGVILLAAAWPPTARGLRSHDASAEHARSRQLQSQSPPQPEAGRLPEIVPGHFYLFIVHDRFGTSLMQQLCNATALALTRGKETCTLCSRVVEPQVQNGDPACILGSDAEDFIELPQFAVANGMGSWEFERLRRHTQNFHAVHMIRDPEEIVVSEYLVDAFLSSPAGSQMPVVTKVKDVRQKKIAEGLEEEVSAVSKIIQDMYHVHVKTLHEARVLEVTLKDFNADYNSTLAGLFQHLFEDITPDQTQHLTDQVNLVNKARMSESWLTKWNNLAMVGNRTAVQRAWGELARAQGSRLVKWITKTSKMMGFLD